MTDFDDLASAARALGRDRPRDLVPRPGGGESEQRDEGPTSELPAAQAGARRSGAPRIGLVLSGGGAKGAYHVGVLRYLAEIGTEVHAIAGASIGALNGAVLAAAGSMTRGADRLATVWDEVAGQTEASDGTAGLLVPEETTAEQLARLLPRLSAPALQVSALERLVAAHVDPDRLAQGIPLWVSAFPAVPEIDELRGWSWALDVVRSRLGARAEWFHVNRLPRHERHQAVLASAALPVILPPRRIGARLYRDGGMADNTPAGALARNAGCDLVIVVHLTEGALWDAHDQRALRIVEIRPRRPLRPPGPLGGATALVDLSAARLLRLRSQGYEDARHVMEPLRAMLSAVQGARDAQARMVESVTRLENPEHG
ncbi:patatin-like phospholipase family protein [Streptomyces erythrochromogenes]|uniref:patatin-like phospholipase family protein n=1 Tax=Streptomyces erythrochromogenes TaxID=285574 RepID=UPI0036A1C88A